MLYQPALPTSYTAMNDDDLIAAITLQRQRLGDRLVILGHHYQQDDVIRFADFTGDSFKLAQLAAEKVQQVGAEFVIFCGVHFMAESADILTTDDQIVVLPDLNAGCSMADMAGHDQVTEAWAMIHDELEDHQRVIPICYMNCSAAIKAFCGEHGGAVCTSSNADRVLRWALGGGTEPKADGEAIKILFLPDQHLGRNTAAAMGYDVESDMMLWDPRHLDDLDPDAIRRSTFLLWRGHCSVHQLFRPEHVDHVRADWPGVKVIVHPECAHAVVQKADMTGSTEGILKTIREAEPGSRWAVGTEVHMVTRLAREVKPRGVEVRILSDCQCLCTTMYRIDMPHLLATLDALIDGKPVNRVSVPADVKQWAMVALDRMLALVGTGNVTAASAG